MKGIVFSWNDITIDVAEHLLSLSWSDKTQKVGHKNHSKI